MPTYEYECENCGYRFEEFQKMSDRPLETCPRCGGYLQRLIGAGAAVIFKGPGSYVNDSKRGNRECDRQSPCCGRESPCENRPCD